MSTVRQQIMDALKTRLETIQAGTIVTLHGGGTHTYLSSLADHVSIWRTNPMKEKEDWIVTIRDIDAPKDTNGEGAEVGRTLHRLRIMCHIVVRDKIAPDEVRNMMADVYAAIGTDPKLSNLCRWITVERDELDVDESGLRCAGANITLTAEYRTNLWRM